MRAVGNAAGSVVEEVRRQLRNQRNYGRDCKADYGRAVDIVTKAALREMIMPALIPIVFPIVIDSRLVKKR